MRRFALRDLRADEGLGLVETVVSLLVFALIMSGLAASMLAYAHSTTLSKARSAATSIAQAYTEKARAVGTTLLENCSNQAPAPPATAQFRNDNLQHVVPTGTDPFCIPYQKPITQDGVNYTLTRLVLVKLTGPDQSGQPQNEKYLVVQLSWTDAGGVAKSYELDTIFTQKGAIAVAPAQGIRFLIKDINGNVIPADGATWSVAITSSSLCSSFPNNTCTDPTATTAEGTYSQLDLQPGSYTCTASSTDDASSGYFPAPTPTYNSGMSTVDATNGVISGTCTVTANTVTDFSTTWKSAMDCAVSTATASSINFSVTDNGNPPVGLTGMTVTLTQLNDGTKNFTKTTGAGGSATGLKPTANWYTYTVTDAAGNYATQQTSYGPVCITAAETLTIPVVMNPVSGCANSSTNGTLTFTVVDATTLSPLGSGYKIAVTYTSTNTVTNFTNTNGSGVSTKAVKGGAYTYTVSPPTGSAYQGSGLVGPICLAAGQTMNIQVPLSTSTCTRNAGKTAYVAFLVTDQSGNPISGATIKLINMNGDGNYQGTTGSDGKPTTSNSVGGSSVKSIKVSDVDPYQYVVTAPNSNYLSSGTLGPICTTQNALTSAPTVVLTALMNVVVTVQNFDTLPWKTYQVSVTDPNSGDVTTQTVTVPNCTQGTSGCTRNPSSPLTFSGLQTGNGWYVAVCAVIKTNCSLVDSATFNFTTPLATYSPPSTPDLAMTDNGSS